MSKARPNLEGLFNGSATAEPQMTWLNGQPAGPEAAPVEPPAARGEPAAIGLFDPVAVAERYFAMLQTLLDLQREFGMRLAHQVAELPGMDRLRR
jgi:hypothetical protein